MRSERGITIIETTVILTVMFILAGAMSPIVSESVTTARAVRAKNDAQMIAMAIVNLQRDLGAALLSSGPPVGTSQVDAQALPMPEVLATGGDAPELDESGSDRQEGLLSLVNAAGRAAANANRGGKRAERRRWRESTIDPIDDHMRTNRKGYPYRRPGESRGWNGPYLSAQIKGDPWGRQYLVNTEWLDGGTTVADADGVPRRAVFVVSPGANGVIETPYEQPIVDATANGDDIVVRIQ